MGYAGLVYETYESVSSSIADFARFDASDRLRLIQIAEQLEAPEQILGQSYSSATWQNATFGAATACAHAQGPAAVYREPRS